MVVRMQILLSQPEFGVFYKPFRHLLGSLDRLEGSNMVLAGYGMADVHLEPVSREVPTTDLLEEIAQYFPVNLDFSE